MYRNILVAVDGSEHSNKALKQAEALARALKSQLYLVHAYPNTSDVAGYSDYDLLVAKRKKKAQGTLDEARAKIDDQELVAEVLLVEGSDAEAVLDAAKQRQVDLIVMGSRGLGTLKGMLLGSVSQKVSHLAECPVLLVR